MKAKVRPGVPGVTIVNRRISKNMLDEIAPSWCFKLGCTQSYHWTYRLVPARRPGRRTATSVIESRASPPFARALCSHLPAQSIMVILFATCVTYDVSASPKLQGTAEESHEANMKSENKYTNLQDIQAGVASSPLHSRACRRALSARMDLSPSHARCARCHRLRSWRHHVAPSLPPPSCRSS